MRDLAQTVTKAPTLLERIGNLNAIFVVNRKSTEEAVGCQLGQSAQVLIEGWRQHYNQIHPHSALGYKPPAPEAKATVAFIAECA